ncbi:MAG: hypothetical protein J6A15_00840 [Clostridia bacterium]|nr:hypothetical protein [Clostridia bacterium]
MSFRESFYQTKQLLVNRLNDFGILSANMNMGWTTLLTIKQNTRITIDVPLNLIYSDEFLITGTLETSTYSRLNGKTVKLKVGDTVVDTTTTNVNGEYSFTHTPVSTGTHSFQVIFEETNVHAASESSIVTREVGKETSVMNLDAVSTQHYGDTLITGGQLLDNDGQYIADASVVYKLNGTTVSTLTTDSYGTFSVTRTINSFATTKMTFEYAGDSNYTNTSANVDVNVYQPQLSLTSNKNILSHADNDNATLTVQVQDNAPVPQNLAISNHLVTLLGYDDYSGETASDFTDTNNIASISDDNQTIVMYSNSSTSDSNIVHNTTFGSKPMLMSFNVDSATISDAGYIAVFNDAGTSMISYLELSTGQYNIYSYNDTDAVVVTKNGSTLGTIKLNGPLSYKIGFYLSETRIVLSDVQVHEIIGSGYTNSSGACTLTYDSQGIGDIVLTAQANINSSLSSEICIIEDCFNALLTEQSISNSSGTKISSVGLDTIYNIRNESFSLEFTHTGNGVLNIGRKSSWSSSTANYRATIGYADGKHYYATRTTSSDESYGDTASTSTEYQYKLTRNGSTLNFYVDDALIGTKSFSTFASYDDWSIYSIIWGSGTSTISNIKLKPL